ncbi:head GIN domain-containing protein [Robertkochia aurantiaca]|uniref:head GIN domain-containing protein n=1 Tax=Robertkochia aurantiaca TaxID=2873700 RepID=UPI001CCBC435|nr:head GIN domain-containing protein [Robertkochia sp. 3YJGBD-33]
MNCVSAQEERIKALEPFTEIKVFDGISVNLIPSDTNKVIIRGKDSEKVVINQSREMLKIRMNMDYFFKESENVVEVFHSKPLDLIDANDNAYISSSHIIEQVDLEVRSQEGSEIDLKIDVDRLEVRSVSGGKVLLKGKATTQDISINTGGEYKGREVVSDQIVISVSAGGVAHVQAEDFIDAKIKAGGTVHIYGEPKVVEEQRFLGGNVIMHQ